MIGEKGNFSSFVVFKLSLTSDTITVFPFILCLWAHQTYYTDDCVWRSHKAPYSNGSAPTGAIKRLLILWMQLTDLAGHWWPYLSVALIAVPWPHWKCILHWIPSEYSWIAQESCSYQYLCLLLLQFPSCVQWKLNAWSVKTCCSLCLIILCIIIIILRNLCYVEIDIQSLTKIIWCTLVIRALVSVWYWLQKWRYSWDHPIIVHQASVTMGSMHCLQQA